jgi:hypothetical protein
MRTFNLLKKYRVIGYGFMLAIVGAMLSLSAPVVHAQGVMLMECNGHDSTEFQPGLTDEIQQYSWRYEDTLACTPPGSNTEITGGKDAGTGSGSLSCAIYLSSGSENRPVTYTWNDEDSSYSAVEYTNVVASVDLLGDTVKTETGTVTSGMYAGNTVTLVTTIASGVINNCEATLGQESAAGQENLTIISLW